jgi:hypothetical protein
VYGVYKELLDIRFIEIPYFLIDKTHLMYTVCLKSKCTDFPMDELEMWYLVETYQRVGGDLGCMFVLVSTGLVASVVR